MLSAWRPRAYLFDFDGTLADSFPAIAASVNHVRALHGLDPLSLDEVRPFVGWGASQLLTKTVPRGDLQANIQAYRDHHPSVLASGTRLLPGARDLLLALNQAGWPVALTSNKPRTFSVELLRILQIDSLFQAVLGPEDVARPKPAPDMLLAALQRLAVSPAEALYVGDMTVDIITGKDAGVVVWVVGTGAQGREVLEAAGPAAYFSDLPELRHALAQIPGTISDTDVSPSAS